MLLHTTSLLAQLGEINTGKQHWDLARQQWNKITWKNTKQRVKRQKRASLPQTWLGCGLGCVFVFHFFYSDMDQEIRQRSVSRCLHLWSRKTELNLLVSLFLLLKVGWLAIIIRVSESFFAKPPAGFYDLQVRVLDLWYWVSDHSSFRVLLHFPSHSGNRPPAAVKPASWSGPGGWSHLPFDPFWLPIGNFLTGSHKVGFPTQKIRG